MPQDLVERIDEYAEQSHDGDRSSAIRDLIEKGFRYEEVIEERDRLRDLTQRRQQASILTRAKWLFFGFPAPDLETEE